MHIFTFPCIQSGALQARKNNGYDSSEAMLTLKQVVKTYASQAEPVQALRGIDLQVRHGEFLTITGRSGSGKTTLINVLTALDRLTSGEIWVDGVAVHRLSEAQAATWRGRSVGVIFQSFQLLPNLTALQNVTLPMDFAGWLVFSQRRQRALELLARLGIAEHANKRPSAVSGGQQQRIAIARALANDPSLVAADEPTGSLDSATARDIFHLFRELVQRGKTIVVMTHDRELAGWGDRVVELSDGEIISETPGNPAG